MSKTAIVYWSGTGNTAAMADAVKDGAQAAGADVQVFTADEFTPDKVDEFDAIAFGCPSMGSEQLEEMEFEPMFDSCKSKLKGKKNCPFRLLWLGRRRMDEHLGGRLQVVWRRPCVRQCYLQ